MTKFIFTAILLLSGLSLFGCNSDTPAAAQPGIEGYVVGKTDDRILVVSSVPKDFSSSGGMKEFYNAIWFSKAPKDIEVGQKVHVWFSYVMESYPGQSTAEKVIVVPSTKPEQAKLTEPEVIRKALRTQGLNSTELSVIKAVDYIPEKDMWLVHIKQGEAEFNVEVTDKK